MFAESFIYVKIFRLKELAVRRELRASINILQL